MKPGWGQLLWDDLPPLDGLREPAFKEPDLIRDALRYSGGVAGQIPHTLVCRLRR